MTHQAEQVINDLAYRLKGYTNNLQKTVARKLYYWGKGNVPRDEDEGRSKDKRKIWGEPVHIADRGATFLRGEKVVGPNFQGKMVAMKEGSIAMIYSNIKQQSRKGVKGRKFDYASAPNYAVGRPQNIQTFLDQNLTKTELQNIVRESLAECSKKL